jgi:hypothetical protein
VGADCSICPIVLSGHEECADSDSYSKWCEFADAEPMIKVLEKALKYMEDKK